MPLLNGFTHFILLFSIVHTNEINENIQSPYHTIRPPPLARLPQPSQPNAYAINPFSAFDNNELWKQFSFENISLNLDIKIIRMG